MSQLAVVQSTATHPLDGIPLAPAAPARLADCSPEQVAERRYLAILDPLLAEAWQQHSLETFVDCLAWTLARVIVGLDKSAGHRRSPATPRQLHLPSRRSQARRSGSRRSEEGGPRAALKATHDRHTVADLAPLAGDAKQDR